MIQEKYQLQRIDFEILKSLQKNPRASFRDIARLIGVSVGTVHARIDKMQSQKVIRNFSVELDYSMLGYELTALIQMRVKGKHLREVESKISHIKNVCVVYDLTGDFDVAIVAKFQSSAAMDQFIKEVLSMDYVERTSTSIVLNSLKESYHIPL
jgi:Lrp/AsnC family transcriptional regulator, regulator for asnA, asnC and gidA